MALTKVDSGLVNQLAKANMPAGSVLQVVQATKTDTFSSTSTSFADITGLSVSITPTSSSSKVLVRFDVSGSASSMAIYRVTRNGTAIGVGDASGSHSSSATSSLQWAGVNSDRGTYGGWQWLDSPATTSACTYQLQCVTDGGTWYINRTTADANATGGPRSSSSITVTEIAA